MSISTSIAPQELSNPSRPVDDQGRGDSAHAASEASPLAFELALSAAESRPAAASSTRTDFRTTAQRQTILNSFAREPRASRATTVACEQELQLASTHSQASLHASSQLAGASAHGDFAASTSAGGDAESMRQPAARDAAATGKAGSSAASEPMSGGAGPIHAPPAASGSAHLGASTHEAPHAAATLRGAAGTTQSVGGSTGAHAAAGVSGGAGGGGALVAAAGAGSATVAGPGMQGKGVGAAGLGSSSVPSGSEGYPGAGVASRTSAAGSQAKAKPFAGLMQAPKAEVPQATMMLRTSKALADALRGGGELKLDLAPELLGRIQVRMSGAAEGGMDIVLMCQEPHAAEAMERTLPQLRRNLDEQGIHAASMRVCLTQATADAPVGAAGPGMGEGMREADAPVAGHGGATPFTGDAGAQGQHEAAHERPARRPTWTPDDDGGLWEVEAPLGTLIASMPVAGLTRAVDVTI